MAATSTVQKATGTDRLLVEGTPGDRELAKIAQVLKRTPCTQLSLTRVTLASAGAFAQVLTLLPKLAELTIYGGRIGDWTPLSKVKTLRKLFVNGVAIDEEMPAPIGQLARVTDLALLHLPRLTHVDVSGCTKLARFSVYSCKNLRDLSSLHALPALREVTLVGTPHRPKDLKALVALPQVRRVAAQFGSGKLNREFDLLLATHGKTRQ